MNKLTSKLNNMKHSSREKEANTNNLNDLLKFRYPPFGLKG